MLGERDNHYTAETWVMPIFKIEKGDLWFQKNRVITLATFISFIFEFFPPGLSRAV